MNISPKQYKARTQRNTRVNGIENFYITVDSEGYVTFCSNEQTLRRMIMCGVIVDTGSAAPKTPAPENPKGNEKAPISDENALKTDKNAPKEDKKTPTTKFTKTQISRLSKEDIQKLCIEHKIEYKEDQIGKVRNALTELLTD